MQCNGIGTSFFRAYRRLDGIGIRCKALLAQSSHMINVNAKFNHFYHTLLATGQDPG
jgi:hypothetical protein